MLSKSAVVATIVFGFLASAHLRADDWPGAQVREVFSRDRQYFVRITPGESWGETWGFAGANEGKHARADFFRQQADKGYRLQQSIDLLNPVAPVDFFVSSRGDLVTLDNWHNRGYGAVLALYQSDGKLLKNYKLADLFPKMEIDSFPHSESSIMWHTGATYIDDAQGIFYMGYREAPDYRELIVELANGSVRLCASVPKYHCWHP